MQDMIHFVADEMKVTSDRISTEGLKADLPDHPGWTKCLQRAIRIVIPENVIQKFFLLAISFIRGAEILVVYD